MSLNQIFTLSAPNHRTLPSGENGQVAPVESVESRVQKILSEIFGRDIAQIISGYHRLRNITSPPTILEDKMHKKADLSYAKISQLALSKCSWDIDVINFNGSIFTEQIDLSRFFKLQRVFASESNATMINWQKCPRRVSECELNRCDLSSVSNQLPTGVRHLYLEDSEFESKGLYRLQKLNFLSLTKNSFCKIDFRKLKEIETLWLKHDGEKPFEVDFSGLFNQLSKTKLRWFKIHRYIVEKADFSKLPGSIRTMHFKECDLREVDMSCFPSNLGSISLEECELNRDSLTQLSENVKDIYLSHFKLIRIDLGNLPSGVKRIMLDRCIVDQEGLPRFFKGLEFIYFHQMDFTKVGLSQFSEKTNGEKSFSLLSEGLKRVFFQGCNLRDVVFSKLPQGLEHLEFQESNLKNVHVSMLPKGIKQIDFFLCNCVNIGFSLFPKSIEKIVFRHCDDENVDFSQFPEYIKVVRVPR